MDWVAKERGGNVYENVKKKEERDNEGTGFRNVWTAGGSTDGSGMRIGRWGYDGGFMNGLDDIMQTGGGEAMTKLHGVSAFQISDSQQRLEIIALRNWTLISMVEGECGTSIGSKICQFDGLASAMMRLWGSVLHATCPRF